MNEPARGFRLPALPAGPPASHGNRFQERAPNRRAVFAAVIAAFPSTFFTVEKISEVEVLWWTVHYGGVDLGAAFITFQIVNKAGTAVTLGTISLQNGEWCEFVTDQQPLFLGAEWSLRLQSSLAINASVVVSGIDRRFPQ